MISIDEMEVILDEVAGELPKEFYESLNGGILLLPEQKYHGESKNNDLFILGEYHRDRRLGKYIAIYYGSFSRLYGHLNKDELREKLRATLRHEFRHHLEDLSGEKGLEIEDSKKIIEYLRSINRTQN